MKAAAGPLLAVGLLAFSLRTSGAKAVSHGPTAPSRQRRGVLWHDFVDSTSDDGVSPYEDEEDDTDDANYDGKEKQLAQRPTDNSYREEWLMDNFLPEIQRRNMLDVDDDFAGFPRYRLFPNKPSPETLWTASPGITENQSAASTIAQKSTAGTTSSGFPDVVAVLALMARTLSSNKISIVPAKNASDSKVNAATLATIASTSTTEAPVHWCPAEAAAPKPEPRVATTHLPKDTLMAKLFRTKSKKTTTPRTSSRKSYTTTSSTIASTTPSTKASLATKRTKISAVANAPPNDRGTFMLNRYAHVKRESAYMEHMDPMQSFTCRVHVWIIAVLSALVLLLTVAHCTSRRPPPESETIESMEPMLTLQTPPPVRGRTHTSMWEDDLYDVSAASNLGKSPSVEDHRRSLIYGQ